MSSTKVQQLLEGLGKRGYRRTKVRVAVIGAFAESVQPMGYDGLAGALGSKKLSPDRATVYRELAFLTREGILRELRLGGGAARYELMSQDHHHHAVCLKCDAVEHVSLERDVDAAERLVARQKKFKILRHSLEFYGLCRRCR